MKNLSDHMARTHLSELIEEDLGRPRKKSGRWVFWLCPFHPDRKTPSLAANLATDTWHCFGCDKGGDAITWLREFRKLSYNDSIRILGRIETNQMHYRPWKLKTHTERRLSSLPRSGKREAWLSWNMRSLNYCVARRRKPIYEIKGF